MKKSLLLLCSLLLIFALTACETVEKSESEVEIETDSEELSLFLKTTGYSTDFNNNGTLLAALRLTYPQLVVMTADGEEFAASDDESVKQVRIAKAFNAKMEAEMETRKEVFNELCSDAQMHYDSLDETQKEYWGNYAFEIDCTSFQSENLISTVALGYWFTDGAHPTSFHQTWNFDLTTGEFVTLDDLTDDTEAVRDAVVGEIMRRIYAEELYWGYFEDYETSVRDLVGTHMSFDEKGLTVRFDLYTIAPYAAGIPEFFIDYGLFAGHLNERGRKVLPVPQEAYVLADFYTAQELWSYFHMSTIPLDYEAPAIEQNGMAYYRVDYQGISTLEELKAHLCLYVTEELAAEWLTCIPDRFIELDGALYCFEADRGSDLRYGEPSYEVALLIDHGSVTALMDTYDTEKIDPVTGEMPIVGDRKLYYHFKIVDGRTIFENFPCIW